MQRRGAPEKRRLTAAVLEKQYACAVAEMDAFAARAQAEFPECEEA